MSCLIGVNSLFGANSYIKFLNSDIVAVEGPNILERLIGKDILIPYKQVIRGRIILKEGQINYLMNHLGLGDNATFVAITARYDAKSVNEEDNYLEFYYSDDTSTIRYMNQLMILTGNSVYRIPQLYFTNPNSTYKVILDVMVAVIDEEYSFFTDTINQTGLSFYDLECNSDQCNIETFVVNETIIIYDNNDPRKPLVYISIDEISSIHITNKIVIIDENNIGRIYLEFITTDDAKQAYSLLSYVYNNVNIIIQNLSPIIDSVKPIAYFKQKVNNTGSYITFNGATATSYDTSYGITFSTSISLTTYGTSSGTTLTKSVLNSLIIGTVSDNRDGIITLTDGDTTLRNYSTTAIDSITSTGTYSMYFNVSDIAGNVIDTNTKITLSIIT